MSCICIAGNQVCDEGQRKWIKCSVCLINNSAPGLSETLTDEGIDSLFAKYGCVLSVEEGHGNVGYGKAQNLSIKQDSGAYSLIMNPDVRVAHDAILEGSTTLRRMTPLSHSALGAALPPGLESICVNHIPLYSISS